MKLKIIVLGMAFLVVSGGYSIAEERKTESPETSMGEEEQGTKSVVKYCPVCGPENEMEGLSLSYKFEGKKYSFCSMDCLKAFKKNPEQYIKAEENNKEGAGYKH